MIVKTLYICFVALTSDGSKLVDHKAITGIVPPSGAFSTRVLVAGFGLPVTATVSPAEILARIKKCELALDPGAEGEG